MSDDVDENMKQTVHFKLQLSQNNDTGYFKITLTQIYESDANTMHPTKVL